MADGNIRDIVNITITRETQAVTRAGFGTPMVASVHTVFAERLRYYSSLSALVSDGFLTTSATYKAVAAALGQNPAPVRVGVGRKDAAETWADALTAIKNYDNNWYGLVVTSRVAADILAVAAWVETERKVYSAASGDAGIIDAGVTNDIASQLQDLSRDRTFLHYSASADEYPDAAWLGKMLPTDPGSATWMFKTLSGIVPANISESQTLALLAKNCNLSQVIGGVKITREGKVASGEFIDIIVGLDWFHARLTERIYGMLVRRPKVPYTDAGLASIEAQIKAQFRDAVTVGLANGDEPLLLTIPKARDIDTNLKAIRRVEGIKFCFTLAGAIHSVEVQGSVIL